MTCILTIRRVLIIPAVFTVLYCCTSVRRVAAAHAGRPAIAVAPLARVRGLCCLGGAPVAACDLHRRDGGALGAYVDKMLVLKHLMLCKYRSS